jgi:hypothetical protein
MFCFDYVKNYVREIVVGMNIICLRASQFEKYEHPKIYQIATKKIKKNKYLEQFKVIIIAIKRYGNAVPVK